MVTYPRVEIPKKVKLEVFHRAGGPSNIRCEGKNCGLPLKPGDFEYDHSMEEWEWNIPPSQRPPITAADVKLLGKKCCHDPKTAKKSGERAHGKRIVEKAAKARTKRGNGFSKRYKQKMNGAVIDTETGETVRPPRNQS